MKTEPEKMSELELRIEYGRAWDEGRFRDAVKLLLLISERRKEQQKRDGATDSYLSALREIENGKK